MLRPALVASLFLAFLGRRRILHEGRKALDDDQVLRASLCALAASWSRDDAAVALRAEVLDHLGCHQSAVRLYEALVRPAHPMAGEAAYRIMRIHARRGDGAAAARWLREAHGRMPGILGRVQGSAAFHGLEDDPSFQNAVRDCLDL